MGSPPRGGPWFDLSATGTFRGETYVRIAGADIVVNNGIGCFFADSPDPSAAAAELFAHELGHTLGLGHSCESLRCRFPESFVALMYAFIHDDGRGAQLAADDRAGLFMLYNTLPYVAGSFFTVTPCRLFDTRRPDGTNGGPHLASGEVRFVEAAGRCGIPTSAQALVINVTAVNATGAGHLTLYPADGGEPGASSLNFAAGQTRANNAILKLSEDSVRALAARAVIQGSGMVDLIVDVSGYFQ